MDIQSLTEVAYQSTRMVAGLALTYFLMFWGARIRHDYLTAKYFGHGMVITVACLLFSFLAAMGMLTFLDAKLAFVLLVSLIAATFLPPITYLILGTLETPDNAQSWEAGTKLAMGSTLLVLVLVLVISTLYKNFPDWFPPFIGTFYETIRKLVKNFN